MTRLSPLSFAVVVACPVLLGAGPIAVTPARGAEEHVRALDTDPALAGWWKFDEASGTSAADSSKQERNGTLAGGLTFDQGSTEGRIGRALEVGGRGHVEIAGYKGVTGTKPRTVAAWVRLKQPGGEILAWGSDEAGEMWFFHFIRNRVGVSPKGGYYYMNDTINDDQWHHVAAVLRQAKLPNLHDHADLYLDGQPAELHDIGLLDLWPIETGSDQDVRMGRGFKGSLDDVRIYQRPLTAEEIAALYQAAEQAP